MAYRSLILGMIFSIGIFAAKGGMGMAFGTMGYRFRSKAAGMAAFALIYGLVFLGAGLVLVYLDVLAHLTAIQGFIQSGMMIHVTMAALMTIWGLVLLKKKADPNKRSRGWLLLVVPCPVCASSILFSAAFFLSLFPERPVWTLTELYLAFVLISLIAMILAHVFLTKTQSGDARSPESLLGGAMLLISAYFIVSVTVMPHVGDLSSVYRLAGYRSTASAPDIKVSIITALVLALAFGWGCFRYSMNRRMS